MFATLVSIRRLFAGTAFVWNNYTSNYAKKIKKKKKNCWSPWQWVVRGCTKCWKTKWIASAIPSGNFSNQNGHRWTSKETQAVEKLVPSWRPVKVDRKTGFLFLDTTNMFMISLLGEPSHFYKKKQKGEPVLPVLESVSSEISTSPRLPIVMLNVLVLSLEFMSDASV